MNQLQPLVHALKQCPSQPARVSRERFLEGWDKLQREAVTQRRKPTVPILAALILADDQFGQLLNTTEQAQLYSLVNLAMERYEQQTQPPNPLGQLLVGIIKKESP